eukprot:1457344-Rhodomonas_salina.1
MCIRDRSWPAVLVQSRATILVLVILACGTDIEGVWYSLGSESGAKAAPPVEHVKIDTETWYRNTVGYTGAIQMHAMCAVLTNGMQTRSAVRTKAVQMLLVVVVRDVDRYAESWSGTDVGFVEACAGGSSRGYAETNTKVELYSLDDDTLEVPARPNQIQTTTPTSAVLTYYMVQYCDAVWCESDYAAMRAVPTYRILLRVRGRHSVSCYECGADIAHLVTSAVQT